MTKKPLIKRRNYFVNKRVQGLYALFIIMSVGIISLLVSMEILRTFYGSFGQMDNESFFTGVNIYFIFKVLALLVLGSLLIGGLSLFASHRIAGPIFRLNKSLKQLAKGHYDERLSFRKHDYFQEIADNFNTMAESFEKRIIDESKLISEMDHKVEDIVEQMELNDYNKDQTMIALQELKELIEHCQQIIREERGY
ncbi:MAG: hypothetical protein RBU23_09320 [Candidatus Auribacterota bacterium]|jgi:methyl-accepting chemotaxis protein|nr:hypothetical protein [Candidatus Auribacterota bacterium]